MKTDYDIFLSYSRADSEIVVKIYEELIQAGFSVFFDRNSIGSDEFPKVIAEGILSAKIFLFIASVNSIYSNYAPDEIIFAKGHKARNSIIVYRIDDSIFPPDIELLFSSLNHRNASVDSIKTIIDDCNKLLSQKLISSTPKVNQSNDGFLNIFIEKFESRNIIINLVLLGICILSIIRLALSLINVINPYFVFSSILALLSIYELLLNRRNGIMWWIVGTYTLYLTDSYIKGDNSPYMSLRHFSWQVLALLLSILILLFIRHRNKTWWSICKPFSWYGIVGLTAILLTVFMQIFHFINL